MKESLTRVWQRILDGDPYAWEELVSHYARLVYATARRNGLDGTDAEDCSQHTWMSLYSSRKSIRDPNRLPIWLMSTAARTARRMIRKNTSRGRAEKHRHRSAPETSAEENLMQLQQWAALESALNALDLRCRRLLRAMFFAPADLSYRDIAQKVGIPFNSLGPVRMRCLKKLRKILDDLQQD